MGVQTALYTGVSGLNATTSAMNVIGNNLANSQTTAFKGNRSLFSDILASFVSSASGVSQIGRGVSLAAVDRMFTQGSFMGTGINTDMAIDGSGFFMVSHPEQEGTKYTRDGSFRFNDQGYLVNPMGYRVQGYDIDVNGNTSGQLTDVAVDMNSAIEPSATTAASFNTNLNQEAEAIAGGFDIDNPNETSNFSTSINVYDSLGESHQVTIYFTKTGDNQWGYNAVVPGADVGDEDNDLVNVGNGTLVFDENGALDTDNSDVDADGLFTTNTIEWANGAADSEIDITLELTQYSGQSALVSRSQNGFASGDLTNLSVNELGIITGSYSNGQSRQLAQVGLANFANPNGLAQDGNNLFVETQASGLASIGAPGSGAGTIRANSLEQSNVDIARQFTDMITTQRMYQANSRIITTSDEMLQEVVNLKR